MTAPTDPTRHLRTAQVAAILHVSPKTVARHAKQGLLHCVLTDGGHRRFPEREIRALARDLGDPDPGRNGARWLSTSEAAAQLQVDPKTIARWAREGKIPAVSTLGGHRHFDPLVIAELKASLMEPVTNPPLGPDGEVRR